MDRAKTAEEQASTIQSWKALRDFFHEFGECDDGAISEGFSDSVVRLLISDWSHVSSLQEMVDTDRDFGSFVLRHIDDLMSPSQLNSIGELASRSCPKDARRICKDIRGRVEEIREDVKGQRIPVSH